MLGFLHVPTSPDRHALQVVVIQQADCSNLNSLLKWEFPSGPVVRTQRFHCQAGFDPWSAQVCQKKKKKKNVSNREPSTLSPNSIAFFQFL